MKELTKGKMWCYAIGQLGWSIISGLIGSWLVYFYQPNQEAVAEGMIQLVPQGRIIFGILTIIGLVTATGRIFDAITDPLVGSWSDKCRSKAGRRIPFLRFSAIPLGLIFVLVFCAPVKHVSAVNSVWLFVTVLAYYFAITCYCTPYTSLLAELPHNQDQKLKLSMCISLTFIVGTALGYSAPVIWGAFIKAGMARVPAMQLTFGILALVATGFMLVPAFTIKERDYFDAKPSQSTMFSSLGKTFKNKNFRVFVYQDIIYFFGLAMFQTGLPFFVTSLLKLGEQWTTVMFIGLTLLSLAFYPFVTKMAARWGKKKLLVAAFVGFVLTFGFTGICGPKLGIPIAIQAALIVVLGSFPQAIFGIIPQTIVADIAQSDEIVTGESRSGMFYAARTFAMKLGQSLAMLLFTSLATIGAASLSSASDAAQASAGSPLGYRVVALVASGCCLAGGIIMAFFNEKKVMAIINSRENNEKAIEE
ncbi:MAG: MFS transporter [Treponemataceae bacterium]|nr:MFS transporter [Treponemataceae bacterium]